MEQLIAFDQGQECSGAKEGWFFCDTPERLQSGSKMPTSAGHVYFEESSGHFKTGLWQCTAHATKEGSYPVNEFIFLLRGNIILTVAEKEHVFSPGDAFFIPKGLKCAWRQPNDVKKFFGVFTEQPPKELELIAFDRKQECAGAKKGWFFCDVPERLQPGSQMPTSAGHVYAEDSSGQFKTGLWQCTAHATKEESYPVNEFIYLLYGTIILTVAGKEYAFSAGDAFFIPKGLKVAWRQTGDVKKIFQVFAPQESPKSSKL